MSTRNFALIAGVIMMAMGILALVPNLNTGAESLPVLYVNNSYGLFLDIFPMNIFNKIALIFFGALGMGAYFSARHSLKFSSLYAKTVFWFMGAAAILGLFPETNTLSGYWPLFGPEVFAHGAFSLFGLYFGFLTVRPDLRTHNHRLHKA